ncbi:MAG: hypothetical protein K6E17_08445 [Clostridiales bacterium]|nr:hypothetical protein [Clostridiales bacterium]
MFTKLRNNRRHRELQEEIEYRIRFNTGMRQITSGERGLKKLADEQKQKAIEEERAGNHGVAVRLAGGSKRLAAQARMTGDMRGTVMTAHVMNQSTKAMADLMECASSLADGGLIADPARMCGMQAEMETMKETLDMAMDQAEEFYSGLNENEYDRDEAGEKALGEIMKNAGRERHKSLIRETGKKLDEMQRSRALE